MQKKSPEEYTRIFYMWLVPIILISKIVRYTVMYTQLVAMSIGSGMVDDINRGHITPFHASLLSNTSSASSVITSNAVALCDMINFFGLSTYTQWEIFFTVVFNLIICWYVGDFYKNTRNVTIWTHIFIYTAVAMLNIFSLNMSKEPYQMLFFMLMASFIKKGKGYYSKCIWLGFAVVLTILYCRKYYGLVFIYFVALQLLVKQFFVGIDYRKSDSRKKIIKGIVVTFMVVAVFQHLFMGFLSMQSESTYNEMMTMSHRDQNRASVASSEIVPLFGTGNPVLVTIDYILKIVRLMCPIELLIKGKIQYFFIIAFQGLMSFFIFRAFLLNNRESKEEVEEREEEEEELRLKLAAENGEVNVAQSVAQHFEDEDEDEDEEDDEEDDDAEDEKEQVDDEEDDEDVEQFINEPRDRIDNRAVALYLYIAFLLCSAAFEPDFGSWTRHESVVFPVLLMML